MQIPKNGKMCDFMHTKIRKKNRTDYRFLGVKRYYL